MKAPPKANNVPEIRPEQLVEADGFLFGSPSRFGMMAAQVKAFFDSTHDLWATQALAGKPAGVFWSTGFHGGGQELTAWVVPFIFQLISFCSCTIKNLINPSLLFYGEVPLHFKQTKGLTGFGKWCHFIYLVESRHCCVVVLDFHSLSIFTPSHFVNLGWVNFFVPAYHSNFLTVDMILLFCYLEDWTLMQFFLPLRWCPPCFPLNTFPST